MFTSFNIIEKGVTFFIYRVIPELNIANLRLELESQLEQEQDSPLPPTYIFIRNVGRHFTTVSRYAVDIL